MTSLVVRAIASQQPQYPAQIDRRFSVPVRAIYLPNSLAAVDLSGNSFNASSSTLATLDVGLKGRVWSFPGTATNRIDLPSASLRHATDMTMIAVINVASTASQQAISNTYFTAGGGLEWAISNAGLQLLTVPGVATLSVDSGTAITTNTWNTVGVRYHAGTGATSTYYLNGLKNSSPACSTGVASQNTAPCIGERFSGSANAFNGKMALYMQFDGLLSDAECLELTGNPWQIFKSVPRKLYLASAANGFFSRYYYDMAGSNV